MVDQPFDGGDPMRSVTRCLAASEIANAASTSYYILRRRLYRVRHEDPIPESWHNRAWGKNPLMFELESMGRRISEEEAMAWVSRQCGASSWLASRGGNNGLALVTPW
jgi:hypothetical protein